MENAEDSEDLLHSAALRTSASILLARQRAEQELIQAKEALERKTEELANSVAMMRATLESTTDGILVTDEEGKITSYNNKYVEMWRIPREVMERADGRKLRELASTQFPDREAFLARISEIHVSSPSESFDVLEFADGRVFERYSKVQTVADRKVGRVWSFRDITEQKRAEETLRSAKLAAENASTAKDDFLAVLSHELRTPLTPALAAASYLAEHADLPPDLLEEVKAIGRNVKLEARLIDDLLDLTRITRGKLELHQEAVDAHRLLHNTIAIVQEDINRKKLELVADLAAGDHWIWADPIRIQQGFWNLLNNAVKFTPQGGRVTIRSFNHEDGRFVLEVTDTGIGIDPAQQARVFKAFEQGERSITRKFGGLGLGLTISKTLLDLHGGEIAVESKGKNQGASFRVALDVLNHLEIQSDEPASVDRGQPKRLRLLVVDDHVETLRVLSTLLRKRGHEVFAAESVEPALALLEIEKIDALISDIGLPGADGYALIREAKRRQPLKGIALSGFGMEEDRRISLAAGFEYHLTKPIDFQQLEKLLREIGQS